MNNLSIISNQSTIKSTELVDLINDFRQAEGNKAQLLHKTFMEKIRKELETLKSLGMDNGHNFLLVKYEDAKGEQRPCYELNRDAMLQMLNSESTYVRAKTIEYINKLEQNAAGKYFGLSKELQAIIFIDQKQQNIEKRLDAFESDMPLFNTDCKEIQKLVKRIGTKSLGGYGTPAYNDKSIRTRIYSDIHQQLRREFGVERYESIKRSQLVSAKQIIELYKAPMVLENEIISINQLMS